LLDAQVKFALGITLPEASVAVAVSWIAVAAGTGAMTGSIVINATGPGPIASSLHATKPQHSAIATVRLPRVMSAASSQTPVNTGS
jgi:hypothetical protein